MNWSYCELHINLINGLVELKPQDIHFIGGSGIHVNRSAVLGGNVEHCKSGSFLYAVFTVVQVKWMVFKPHTMPNLMKHC